MDNIFCIDDALSAQPPNGFCGPRSNKEGQRPAKRKLKSQNQGLGSKSLGTPVSRFERGKSAATSHVNDERCGFVQRQADGAIPTKFAGNASMRGLTC